MDARLVHHQTTDIKITRKVYDETCFETTHSGSSCEESSIKQFRHTVQRKLSSCACTANSFLSCLFGLFPIIRWLPKYNLKRDLSADITGGITVGIMHIPQGLAFAMLANLPPVTGLYTALIPVLVYMIMGTSRHLSVGSFAVICLMVAQVVNREVGPPPTPGPSPTPGNFSSTILTPTDSGGSLWTPYESKKLEVALSLSLLIGIIQIVMGAVKLGCVATYLSDPMISGFTTGSAVLVVISQVKLILGLKVPAYIGAFAAVKSIIFMLKNIPSANVGAIITGVLSLLVLIALKQVNDRCKHRLKVPIPGELLVVIVGTAISYGAKINAKWDVPIIGDIPKGLPPVSVPSLSKISNIFSDAFVIAIVIFATNISLARMFAKKRGYSVDPNQELIAYGAGNLAGSFFSCFPICNALARTAVQENLANTQLCSLVVIALILLVLLFIAQLFFHLPKAILAAVVIANLIGLLKQFSRLRDLWKIYKPDAVVWFCSCFGVILLGVDVGLGVGVISALFAVVFTLSRSKYFTLGQVKETELYRDIKQYPSAFEVLGVKVLRLESPLYFGNVERFRNMLVTTAGLDPASAQQESRKLVSSDPREKDELLSGRIRNEKPTPGANGPGTMTYTAEVDKPKIGVHTVVIDCSSFTYIDSVGLHALPALVAEFTKVGVHIYLAGCSSNLLIRLAHSAGKAAIDEIPRDVMFPSIHDAVMSAVRARDHMESVEHDKETNSELKELSVDEQSAHAQSENKPVKKNRHRQ